MTKPIAHMLDTPRFLLTRTVPIVKTTLPQLIVRVCLGRNYLSGVPLQEIRLRRGWSEPDSTRQLCRAACAPSQVALVV